MKFCLCSSVIHPVRKVFSRNLASAESLLNNSQNKLFTKLSETNVKPKQYLQECRETLIKAKYTLKIAIDNFGNFLKNVNQDLLKELSVKDLLVLINYINSQRHHIQKD